MHASDAHLDESSTHLQMCKFKPGLTIRTHDLLNRKIAVFHKGIGFITTLVVKPQFQSADDSDVLKTDQVILRNGFPLHRLILLFQIYAQTRALKV